MEAGTILRCFSFFKKFSQGPSMKFGCMNPTRLSYKELTWIPCLTLNYKNSQFVAILKLIKKFLISTTAFIKVHRRLLFFFYSFSPQLGKMQTLKIYESIN
jgi:hypothetical protein